MAPYFMKSKRGGNILVNDGFMYHKRCERKGRTYWNCINKQKCSGTAISDNKSSKLISVKVHSHAPSQERVTCIEVLNQMKRQALTHPEMSSSQIINKRLKTVSNDVLVHLPERATIRRTLNRQRKAQSPPDPKNFGELEDIPEEHKVLSTDEQFLLYDNYDEKNAPRILIYATKSNLIKLGQSTTWFTDGSFKINPSIMMHMFVIRGLYQGDAFPFVYALFQSQTTDMYKTVFCQIKLKSKELGISLPDPETIVSDLEQAMLNAQKQVFPDARVRLSFVHFKQKILKAVENEGLRSGYMNPNRAELKTGIHQLISLAFIPSSEVSACFDLLLDDLPDDLLDLADFIEQTYIRGRNTTDRTHPIPPKYPPELWNQFQAAQNVDPEANDFSEDWHNRFQKIIGKHYSSPYRVIRAIFKEQSNTECILEELETETRVKESVKLKHRKIVQHLQRTTLHYEEYAKNNQINDYLQACACVFTL